MGDVAPLIDTVSPGWIIANDAMLVLVALAPALMLGWYLATLAMDRICPPPAGSEGAAKNGNGYSSPESDQRQRDQDEANRLRAEALELAKGKPGEP